MVMRYYILHILFLVLMVHIFVGRGAEFDP